MVGLLPLCATTVIEAWQRERIPRAMAQILERLRRMPELLESIHPTGPGHFGVAERGIMALVNPERLRRILTKMLDENEFLGPYGIRSLSKFHEQHPYVFHVGGQEYRVDYLPAESNTGMFGGNSNWRGPVWMPVNAMIIRALLNFYLYYGDNFKIECPTGSGKMMNLFEVSKEIADRLTRIFLRDEQGRRPVYGGTEKFQTDPHWRDHILFYEYFHGDNGAGLGASHQTGWTGLVAKIIQLYGLLDPKRVLEVGKKAAFEKGVTHARATRTPSGIPSKDRPDPVQTGSGGGEGTSARPSPPSSWAHGPLCHSPFIAGQPLRWRADLASTPSTGVHVQVCGDAHLSNFGGFATPERRVLFSINDLDETLPAPWEWDIKRLAASFFVACRDNGLSDASAGDVVRTCTRTYRKSMAEFSQMKTLELWYSRNVGGRSGGGHQGPQAPQTWPEAPAEGAGQERRRGHLSEAGGANGGDVRHQGSVTGDLPRRGPSPGRDPAGRTGDARQVPGQPCRIPPSRCWTASNSGTQP